jgi:hypothetical protein
LMTAGAVALPDSVGMIALKTLVRTVRNQARSCSGGRSHAFGL